MAPSDFCFLAGLSPKPLAKITVVDDADAKDVCWGREGAKAVVVDTAARHSTATLATDFITSSCPVLEKERGVGSVALMFLETTRKALFGPRDGVATRKRRE